LECAPRDPDTCFEAASKVETPRRAARLVFLRWWDPARRLRALEALSRDRDPREAGQTIGQRRFLELDLWKAPRQEVVVGLHVEVPVSAEVEQDDLRLAGLPRTDRLVDHRPDGVIRLRGRHDPLSPSELYARVEHLVLRV